MGREAVFWSEERVSKAGVGLHLAQARIREGAPFPPPPTLLGLSVIPALTLGIEPIGSPPASGLLHPRKVALGLQSGSVWRETKVKRRLSQLHTASAPVNEDVG